MKTSIYVITAYFFTLLTLHAQVEIPQERWVKLFDQGNYAQIYEEAIKHRSEVFGKTALTDFFIAKSLCADGHPEKSKEWFAHILKSYNLTEESKINIEDDQQSCSRPQQPRQRSNPFSLAVLQTLATTEAPESVSRGKGGRTSFNCNVKPPRITTIRQVTKAELQARLFDFDQGEDAISAYKSILGPGYSISYAGRFIIISKGSSQVNQEEASEISRRLQRAYDFYVEFYDMRLPDKFISVFLLPKESLVPTAEKLHGIRIPDSFWGYSNISDLSLVGWADQTAIGTLFHEMFHLLIRTEIGDAPPWLDEGLASVYEQTRWEDNVLKGLIYGWRFNKVLTPAYKDSELRYRIPKLGDLLEKNWDEYDGAKAGDICTVSIHYAYGRNFMVFLQEKKLLHDLFIAMRDRVQIDEDGGVTILTSTQVIEELFAMPIDEVEAQLIRWTKDRMGLR